MVRYPGEMEAGRAVVTRDGGVVILDVVEIGGVLVDLATGEAVDLVSLVVVTGLPPLAESVELEPVLVGVA